MKTIILLTAVLISFMQSYGQQRVRPVHDKNYYLEKSEKLNTSAWVLVTTGAIATTAGILIVNNNQNSGDFGSGFNGVIAGALLATVGAAAVIGSIPLFVVGGHLKKKAARFSFNNQRIPMPLQNAFVTRMQPGVSLRISL